MSTTSVDSRAADGATVQRADARRNRAKVLLAAREQFAREGLDAQMDDIARAAGVGVGTVYRHFPTKEDLIRALADARFEAFAAAGKRSLELADPWAGLVQFLSDCARVIADDVAISEAMEQRPGLCHEAAMAVDMRGITGQVVERAKASGQLRPDIDAEDIPSLMRGLGSAVHSNQGPAPMSWERYLEILLAGIRARG